MEQSENACGFCWEPLKYQDALFCSSCGHVIIKNTNIYEKSTSSYDPFGRYSKPWKEPCSLPKRNYKNPIKKLKPWYPTLKVATRKINKKPIIEITSVSNLQENDQNTNNNQTIEGDSLAPVELLPESQSVISELVEPDEAWVREKSYPLSAIELLSSNQQFSNQTHYLTFNLIIQSFGETKRKHHWLQVGILTDTIDDNISTDQLDPENTSSKSQSNSNFTSICFIPNTVSRLIHPNFEEWVDLFAIDPTEYYMIQHLEKVLIPLSIRVLNKPIINESTLKYLVSLKNFRRIHFSLFSHKAVTQGNLLNALFSDTKELGRSKVMSHKLTKHTDYSSEYIFDTTIISIISKLRMSRSQIAAYCDVRVNFSVEYSNRYEPNSAQWSKWNKESFLKSAEATHIMVYIQPQVPDEYTPVFKDSLFTFDMETIQRLLPNEVKIDEILREAADTIDVLVNYIDKLISLIRIDYVQDSIEYSVVGVFSDPVCTSEPWPEDIENSILKYQNMLDIDEEDEERDFLSVDPVEANSQIEQSK